MTEISDEVVEKQFNKYVDLFTTQAEDADVIKAVKRLYRFAGLKIPGEIEIFDNPKELVDYLKAKHPDAPREWAGIGMADYPWLAYYELGESILESGSESDKKLLKLFRDMKEHLKTFYDGMFYDTHAFVVRKPLKLIFDGDVLSSYEEPAVQFRGLDIWAVNGKREKRGKALEILSSKLDEEKKKFLISRMLKNEL